MSNTGTRRVPCSSSLNVCVESFRSAGSYEKLGAAVYAPAIERTRSIMQTAASVGTKVLTTSGGTLYDLKAWASS